MIELFRRLKSNFCKHEHIAYASDDYTFESVCPDCGWFLVQFIGETVCEKYFTQEDAEAIAEKLRNV